MRLDTTSESSDSLSFLRYVQLDGCATQSSFIFPFLMNSHLRMWERRPMHHYLLMGGDCPGAVTSLTPSKICMKVCCSGWKQSHPYRHFFRIFSLPLLPPQTKPTQAWIERAKEIWNSNFHRPDNETVCLVHCFMRFSINFYSAYKKKFILYIMFSLLKSCSACNHSCLVPITFSVQVLIVTTLV